MIWLLLFLGVLAFAWFMYMPREEAGGGGVTYQPPQTDAGYGMTNADTQSEGLTGVTTGAEPPALAAQADPTGVIAAQDDPSWVTDGYPISREGVPTSAPVDPAAFEVDHAGATAAGTGYGGSTVDAATSTTAGTGYGDDTIDAAGFVSEAYEATTGGAGFVEHTATTSGASYAEPTASAHPEPTGFAHPEPTASASVGVSGDGEAAGARPSIETGIDVTDAATAGIGADGMDFVTPADPD